MMHYAYTTVKYTYQIKLCVIFTSNQLMHLKSISFNKVVKSQNIKTKCLSNMNNLIALFLSKEL